MLVPQHNCAVGRQVVELVLQTGKEMEAEVVIMQVPRKAGTKGSTASHPAYNLIKGGENSKVWTAQAKTSRKQITSRTDLTGGAEDYIQVLDIAGGGLPGGSIRVVNAYDRTPPGEPRTAQQADHGRPQGSCGGGHERPQPNVEQPLQQTIQ